MNIGMTGTRFGLTEAQAGQFRDTLKFVGTGVFHHGDCVGADADCHDIAESLGWDIVIHPPFMDKLRANKPAGDIRKPDSHLRRNRAIVAEADLVIATPGGDTETRRSGTWYTVRHAMKQGVPVLMILPDSKVIKEEEILERLLPGRWGE